MRPTTPNHSMTCDAWGQALLDHLAGVSVPELELQDDDGNVGPATQPEWVFHDEPAWEPEERRLLRLVTDGPVLDLGAGAGRVSLHLQQQGLDVTAVESSPGAVEVCRLRGLRDVRLGDLNAPPSDRRWRCVLLLCGNLGLGGSWDGNRRLLRRLAEVCEPSALLIGDSVNYTGSAEIGLRIRYGDLTTPWWRQRNIAASEVEPLVADTGWVVTHHIEAANGVDHYFALRLGDIP